MAESSGVVVGPRDPLERWRQLPTRPAPETWITEQAVVAVPGSLAQWESELQTTEARYLIERGCGLL